MHCPHAHARTHSAQSCYSATLGSGLIDVGITLDEKFVAKLLLQSNSDTGNSLGKITAGIMIEFKRLTMYFDITPDSFTIT